jgi:ParB family chromosome partitioning protein
MPKQRFGLGRGLDALIPGSAPVADETLVDAGPSASGLLWVPVGAITPNPHQPRGPVGEDDSLIELATSIQEHGLLQPLLVAQAAAGDNGLRYQLIAGERRWRAARLAGLEHVPVLVRDTTPQSRLEMALVENLQRSDLNPLEAAQGYATLMEEYGLTQEEVAQRVGRERSTVANTLRLLQLPAEVREKLVTQPKVFTEGHARAVLQIPGDAERIHATQQIIAQTMSVRGAEELARRYAEASVMLTPDRRGGKARPQNYETRELEEEFTRAVQMKVRLQRTTKGKGSLTLYFTSPDQLQLLYQWLVGVPAAAGRLNGGADLYSIAGVELSPLSLPNGSAHGGSPAVNGAGRSSGAGDALDDEFDIDYDEE